MADIYSHPVLDTLHFQHCMWSAFFWTWAGDKLALDRRRTWVRDIDVEK